LLYYTVRQRSPDRLCISVAASASPEGPFIDTTTGPLECANTSAIDPSPFVAADGTLYLLFKAERPSRIYARSLAPDGRSFTAPPELMLTPTAGWENGVVEAPSMLRNGSMYWLFYSGNDWNSKSYAEGVARCDGPVGPCHALAKNPVLETSGRVVSPGGGEVFTDSGGAWWMAYHAYQDPLVKYPNSRLMRLARVGFAGDGTPTVTP
jgi:beta-xylosidase